MSSQSQPQSIKFGRWTSCLTRLKTELGSAHSTRWTITIAKGLRIIRAPEQVIEWRDKPVAIRCDENISGEMMAWANKHQITMLYIQPSMPTQNAYVERFNRTARHEWLDMHSFNSIEHAQQLATEWLWIYTNERLHTAINGIPPRQMLKAV